MIDKFIGSIGDCLAPGYKFPSLGEPGMPSLALGAFKANLAGVDYVLGFLPPNPLNPPSPPGISLFLKPFLGALPPMSYSPGISYGPLVIPPIGVKPPDYDTNPNIIDPTGMLKLAVCCVMLPFKAFLGIIESILNLSPKIPDPAMLQAIFNGVAAGVGLPETKFATCLPKATYNLLKSLIPV